MSVKTYSVAKNGNTQLQKNFKVKEFKCKDGSDKVLISDELVEVLQQVRDHFGKAVKINSAYRSAAYNKSVGGSSKSQHCQGTAADICISGVDPLKIALYVASLPYFQSHGGIGYYSRVSVTQGFVHVDVRTTRSRWISKTGTQYLSVNSIMPTIKKGSKDGYNSVAYSVTVLQRHLGLNADGKFGPNTEATLIKWQTAHGLTADGVAGPKTWAALSS